MASGAAMNGQPWIIAVDIAGRRHEFAAAELPVTVGSGAGADVALDGVPGAIQIGRLGNVFFVQAERNARNLRVGGEQVTGSRELADGEVIAFDRARLACRIVGNRLELALQMQVTAGDTAPPDLADLARGASPGSGDLAIVPIAFKPTAAAAKGARGRPSNAALGIAAACAVLAALAWFAFTAKSVALNFAPSADQVALPSTTLKVHVGERFLLRPGQHRVEAQLAGYYPLSTNIDVGTAPDQSIALEFTKLPGLVNITTEPAATVEVQLDGVVVGRTPLNDVEIKPGTHRVQFDADRFLTQVLELEVRGGGERQSLVATLTRNWAPVSLRTDPPGAEVLVDGMPAGLTPAALELTAGERDLEVRLNGYNAWRGKVVVNANQPQELPDVKLAQADGRLEVASNPSEANVSLDGEFRGRTPLTLRLTPGRSHQLTLAKPGFETSARDLSVAADSGRRLTIDLTAQYGEIDVRSEPSGAEILIDGQQQGTTPSRLTLTAVNHDVEIRLASHATASMKVTPRPGFPQVLDNELTALDVGSGSGYAPLIRTALKQELKLIPAGQFTMGSSRREMGRRSNEVLRPVRLTHAFYLGRREVTNAEFRAYKADHSSGEFSNHTLNDDKQPVVRVTWAEVAQFLNWLSVKDGLQPVYEEKSEGWVAIRPLRSGYRLPTEAEWEWAARFAGQENALVYPWGAELPPPERFGNFADISAKELLPTTLVTYDDGYPVSAPVGSFEVNGFGLFDIGGNVSEWIQDRYSIDALDTTEVVDDPLGPVGGDLHVVRGPSWRSATVTDLRFAYRAYASEAREDIGFRIARNLN